MQNIVKALKLATLLGLAVATTGGASPAAAVSFSQSGSVSKSTTAGSNFVNLTSSATTFCFLTTVGMSETDTAAETATCRLTRGAVVWTLEAVLGASSDATVRCAAVCYNN